MQTAEHARLAEIANDIDSWRRWGPYIAERAWATVREDYSADGEAWTFLPHDHARSKAYRWGEDGIAGICDRFQILCFAPAFWNGQDPILKERLFGLTPHEGNHGEDVKEYYFHLDNTPTHSYMRYLYKYPHQAFPYTRLIKENQNRQGQGLEFELLDTGIFAEDRYFDIVIEYAKLDPEDLCIRIEAFNRGPAPAELHVLPHLWFRNTWAWGSAAKARPSLSAGSQCILCDDSEMEIPRAIPVEYRLGRRALYGPPAELLFTENETNLARFGRSPSSPTYFSEGDGRRSWAPLPRVASRTASPPAPLPEGEGRKWGGALAEGEERYTKDAFHRYLIDGEQCTNPRRMGTKAAFHCHFPTIPAGGSVIVRLRLSPRLELDDPLKIIDETIALRRLEADAFYQSIHPHGATRADQQLQRQAFAGLLWTKQSYLFDVETWLDGDDPKSPPPAAREQVRNRHWRHLNTMRVMTVPDKWEYPWFAAWDLAFHCVTFVLIDPQYAKDQLWVLLFEQFQHSNGQLPAYEWEFSDLNPPVHAWAVWRVFHLDRLRSGKADRVFLERCFHKLLMNFTWWINKVDREGNCIFEGGFLGLDNITVVDRSVRCPNGEVLEQADATGWIAMFCLNMMRIALELAGENPVYEGLAVKFFQHYVYVAHAMKNMGNRDYQLWDDADGFFYDVLRFPDGRFEKFRVRSMVGLIPLFAVERIESDWLERFPEFGRNVRWFLKNRQDLVRDVIHSVERDGQTIHVLTVVNHEQLVRLLERIWDEEEFLSPFGIRSLSKYHEKRPFVFAGQSVGYEPAEAATKMKGGNSNWRGPIWFPTNFLLIESLRQIGKAFGNDVRVNLPGGRGLTFPEMARDIAERLLRIYRRDEKGWRPVFGGTRAFQEDPHWRDHLLFYEYFHGDNGAGLGASHQTGWTALVASLLDTWGGDLAAPQAAHG